MPHHRIIRFDIPHGSNCPMGIYTWERTPTGFSLALDDKDADTMRKALVGSPITDWTEHDATDDYFIGTTQVDHSRDNLGTILLEDGPEGSTVAVLRKNVERVLCMLHDFKPLRKLGMSFVLDAMGVLVDRIDAHVAKAEEKGDIALLDAVEMARTMRAILNRDVMFVSNMSAPMQRARDTGYDAIWSPDIRWPANGAEGQPVAHLVRGISDEGEAADAVTLDAATLMDAATAFFAGSQAFNVCVVRSLTQEAVFARRTTGDVVTEATWTFERGGPLFCPKPEHADRDHYFVETSNDSAVEYPGHPAARRGVEGWLLCHHCDAWADYNYGDGIIEAIDDALAIAPPVKP